MLLLPKGQKMLLFHTVPAPPPPLSGGKEKEKYNALLFHLKLLQLGGIEKRSDGTSLSTVAV